MNAKNSGQTDWLVGDYNNPPGKRGFAVWLHRQWQNGVMLLGFRRMKKVFDAGDENPGESR